CSYCSRVQFWLRPCCSIPVASSYSAARTARLLRMELTEAGGPNVSPSVQTAAITMIRSGTGLKASSHTGRERPAPGSRGTWPSRIESQTFFTFLAGCEEEDTSKTRAETGLPLWFVIV